MSFADFLNEAGRDIKKKEDRDNERFKGLVSERADDRNIALWVGYKTIDFFNTDYLFNKAHNYNKNYI